MPRLILVLGDQLSDNLSALREAREGDVVVMAEVMDEASYVRHHPKKIAFVFAAMRKFAHALEQDGWKVVYTQLDDTDNAGSIVGELLRRAAQTTSWHPASPPSARAQSPHAQPVQPRSSG